jgi:hypothetical protein
MSPLGCVGPTLTQMDSAPTPLAARKDEPRPS